MTAAEALALAKAALEDDKRAEESRADWLAAGVVVRVSALRIRMAYLAQWIALTMAAEYVGSDIAAAHGGQGWCVNIFGTSRSPEMARAIAARILRAADEAEAKR